MPIVLPRNPNAPHQAVIRVSSGLYEVLSGGDCDGTPVLKNDVLTIILKGNDRYDAETKLNEFLEGVKAKCQVRN